MYIRRACILSLNIPWFTYALLVSGSVLRILGIVLSSATLVLPSSIALLAKPVGTML